MAEKKEEKKETKSEKEAPEGEGTAAPAPKSKKKLFIGIGAVKMTEKVDLIIQIELWDPQKSYERMGISDEYLSILGISVPSITIPVKPGRNLAIIIEVAAMNNRQKRMGYNAAEELLQRLGMNADGMDTTKWSSLE